MTARARLRNATTWAARQRWSVRPPRPSGRPPVRASGPDWFVELVSDEFEVLDDESDAVMIRWEPRSTEVAPGVVARPFVSPRRSHPGSRRRLPKGCPDEFWALDAAARRQHQPADARGVHTSSEDADPRIIHEAYRSAHRLSLLDAIGNTSTGADSARPQVDVVCVSRRPDHVLEVSALFDAQTYDHRHLTIVTTVPAGDHPKILELRSSHPSVRIVERPGATLGACLNEFVDTTSAALVAKWDDDDWYGPNYLLDLVLDHNATGATVTGKHSYLTYLEHLDRTYLRFPNEEYRDTSFLAGGTLLIDRAMLGGVRFPDVNLGEDRAFLHSCVKTGLRVRSADSFNYVQLRGADNTWQVSDADFLACSTELGSGLRIDRAAV